MPPQSSGLTLQGSVTYNEGFPADSKNVAEDKAKDMSKDEKAGSENKECGGSEEGKEEEPAVDEYKKELPKEIGKEAGKNLAGQAIDNAREKKEWQERKKEYKEARREAHKAKLEAEKSQQQAQKAQNEAQKRAEEAEQLRGEAKKNAPRSPGAKSNDVLGDALKEPSPVIKQSAKADAAADAANAKAKNLAGEATVDATKAANAKDASDLARYKFRSPSPPPPKGLSGLIKTFGPSVLLNAGVEAAAQLLANKGFDPSKIAAAVGSGLAGDAALGATGLGAAGLAGGGSLFAVGTVGALGLSMGFEGLRQDLFGGGINRSDPNQLPSDIQRDFANLNKNYNPDFAQHYKIKQ